jgi:hypothetical protein
MIPKFTRILEKTLCHFPNMAKLCMNYYNNIVKEEVNLAQISSEDHMLFIGGGALPSTAYRIHQYTGARVDVIDKDRCAVKLAKKLTGLLGYQKFVEIFEADGRTIDTKKYSVILIALQACPHQDILENALDKAAPNTRIITRCPAHGLQAFYEKTSRDSQCYTSVQAIQGSPTLEASFLFIKNERRGVDEKGHPVICRDSLNRSYRPIF